MRRGLQLWEWIALIFVALVGIAIFFPVYACACGPASSTACISNVKQLATGQLMYAADWNDRLPSNIDWSDAIKPYVKGDDLFHHPRMEGSLELSKDAYGYAFNSDVSMQDTEKMLSPEQVPMLFDSVNYSRNASDPMLTLPVPGRHKGKNNFGYVDGHAKGLASPQAR